MNWEALETFKNLPENEPVAYFMEGEMVYEFTDKNPKSAVKCIVEMEGLGFSFLGIAEAAPFPSSIPA